VKYNAEIFEAYPCTVFEKLCKEDTKLVLRYEYQVSRLKPLTGLGLHQLKQLVG
jgi:hypothetical protein